MDGPSRQFAFRRPVSVGEEARKGVVTMSGIRVGVVGIGGLVGAGVEVGAAVSVGVIVRVTVGIGVFVKPCVSPVTGMNGKLPALALRTYPPTIINVPMLTAFHRNLRIRLDVEG